MRVIAVAAALLLASTANAIPVTYTFSGTLDQSHFFVNDDSAPDFGVYAGTEFSGLINYDADAASCFITPGDWRICNANMFWMVTFGNFVLASTNPDVKVDDHSILTLGGGYQLLPLVYDGWSILPQSDTYLSLSGSPISLLNSPGAPADLSIFQSGYFLENAYIRPVGETSDKYLIRWDISGTITEFHRVPEPATIALLSMGLLMVAASTRRRRIGHNASLRF